MKLDEKIKKKYNIFIYIFNLHKLKQQLVIEGGFRPRKIYCVGHSLGAHACANAGKFIQSEFGFRLGRITGLDAAGPLFEKCEEPVRLDKSGRGFTEND